MGPSPEQVVLEKIDALIAAIRGYKPNDRGELDRVYAVMLTDLEKVRAYWMVAAVQRA